MFFYDDLTREAISHFVGSFSMSLEEARARLEYLEFRAAQLAAEQLLKMGYTNVSAIVNDIKDIQNTFNT